MTHTQSEDPRVSRHVRLASVNQGQTASLQLHWPSASGTPTRMNTQSRLSTPLSSRKRDKRSDNKLKIDNRKAKINEDKCFIDYSKAFACVNHTKLWTILRLMCGSARTPNCSD
ncbi:hypothetical protein LAZ67_14001897 [Cordylochernes scorpioides]|uniref:Uncharacterized protein n=1 Tax=Cordylochernes scorpioides TaxID=51811 RepID=A0ABY6L7H3_9ARAC|nr:hypothetical protein LAZ67_14001897 [Cordylochernes scorpioides]